MERRWETLLAKMASPLGACYAALFEEERGKVLPLAWWGKAQLGENYDALARLALAKLLVLERGNQGEALGGEPVTNAELPLLCVPFSYGDNSRGALILGFTDGEGLSRQLPVVGLMAELLAEIVALQEELTKKEEQVRDLVRNTLEAQEAERERICLEVHDGVTQTLASAFHYLQTLEGPPVEGTSVRPLLLKATSLVRQAIQESREIINSLQPATLRDLGLVATLRQEIRQLEAETGWKVEFKADAIRLPLDMETGLYRIIGEALANARKHSGTKRLRFQLKQQGDKVVVEVKDWGVGFAPFVERRKSPGLGFHSMRRRASLWGGNCSVESAPGQGTTVRVEIPMGGQGND